MAEWSKALVLGTSLFGGVGSNPTPVMFFFPEKKVGVNNEKVHLPGIEPGTYRVLGGRHNQLDHRCGILHYPGFEPGLSLPQSEVLTTILIVLLQFRSTSDRILNEPTPPCFSVANNKK